MREYTEQLHSDLPATRLRGYVQLNQGTDAERPQHGRPRADPLPRPAHPRPPRAARCASSSSTSCPLGRHGDLFLPVDTTTRGAGTGPRRRRRRVPAEPRVAAPARRARPLDQRRLAVPVDHAGRRDAAPTAPGPAWSTSPTCGSTPQGRPVGEGTPGATNDPGPGATTLYFPNDQSARFLYLHDDTFGLTRLSVYAGEAAPYFVGDAVEDELVGRPATGPGRPELPLIIEDKTFVPDAEKLRVQDPDLGHRAVGRPRRALVSARLHAQPGRRGGRVGPATINAKGRWDYLPWYWQGYEGTENGPVANPLFGDVASQPEAEPGHAQPLRGAQRVPRHHAGQRDRVPVSGGRAQGLPAAHPQRLRRPPAEPAAVLRDAPTASPRPAPDGRPELQTDSGEVAMLPAAPSMSGGWPVRWPTDGRAGGVPDPRAVGPAMIQIGNDGGLLPRAVTHKSTPVGLEIPACPAPRSQAMGEYASDRRRDGQGALPRARRARRRDRGLLAGPGRLQAHPVQRRAGARPQRGQPRGLLHGRLRPDRHRRRAGHRRGLRPQHPHHHAVPGRRPGRAAVRPRAAAARAAGRLRGGAGPRPGPDGRVRRGVRDHDGQDAQSDAGGRTAQRASDARELASASRRRSPAR